MGGEQGGPGAFSGRCQESAAGPSWDPGPDLPAQSPALRVRAPPCGSRQATDLALSGSASPPSSELCQHVWAAWRSSSPLCSPGLGAHEQGAQGPRETGWQREVTGLPVGLPALPSSLASGYSDLGEQASARPNTSVQRPVHLIWAGPSVLIGKSS